MAPNGLEQGFMLDMDSTMPYGVDTRMNFYDGSGSTPRLAILQRAQYRHQPLFLSALSNITNSNTHPSQSLSLLHYMNFQYFLLQWIPSDRTNLVFIQLRNHPEVFGRLTQVHGHNPSYSHASTRHPPGSFPKGLLATVKFPFESGAFTASGKPYEPPKSPDLPGLDLQTRKELKVSIAL
jgi:hypothetical protein